MLDWQIWMPIRMKSWNCSLKPIDLMQTFGFTDEEYSLWRVESFSDINKGANDEFHIIYLKNNHIIPIRQKKSHSWDFFLYSKMRMIYPIYAAHVIHNPNNVMINNAHCINQLYFFIISNACFFIIFGNKLIIIHFTNAPQPITTNTHVSHHEGSIACIITNHKTRLIIHIIKSIHFDSIISVIIFIIRHWFMSNHNHIIANNGQTIRYNHIEAYKE